MSNKPDFWEGYVPEPVKPATEESSATQAQQALDKKAENARELGLDYEPAQQEPVAIKHMMGWVESLKRLSDYGQHMRIPGLNAGACFELAIELEQFINTSPPAQRTWVGLTDEERDDILDIYITAEGRARAIEHKLKEKNT